jgi:hypothetical protein
MEVPHVQVRKFRANGIDELGLIFRGDAKRGRHITQLLTSSRRPFQYCASTDFVGPLRVMWSVCPVVITGGFLFG